MFTTQWSRRDRKQEKSSPNSVVSNVAVVPNSTRIGQMVLTGALVQAANQGYDFRADERIPKEIFVDKMRGVDVVDLMQATRDVKSFTEEFINEKLRPKPPVVETPKAPQASSGSPSNPAPGTGVDK